MTDPRRSDAGLTLIEMSVALALSGLVLVVFTSGIVTSHATFSRTERIAAAQSQIGHAFTRLDADLRYASAASEDPATASFYYVLPPRPVPPAGSGVASADCFRLQLTGQRLVRTFLTLPTTPSAPPSPTVQVLASGISGGGDPFAYETATPRVMTLRLVAVADGGTVPALAQTFQMFNINSSSSSRIGACRQALD